MMDVQTDREDFKKAIAELGFTELQIRAISENTADMTDLPDGGYKIIIGNSQIEGKGVFTTADIEAGELIAPTRIGNKRTIVGRYANHSPTPNAVMKLGKGLDVNLIALRKISGEEITVNYRDVVALNREICGTDTLSVLESSYSLAQRKNEMRKMIADLEETLLKLPQLEVPIKEYFSNNVYAREMIVPKGSIVVGKIHRFQNLNILSAGEVTVFSIDGKMRVKAPFTFVASEGSKRVFYMHEDSVWTTILGTDEKDWKDIEKIFIAKDYAEIDARLEKLETETKGEICQP